MKIRIKISYSVLVFFLSLFSACEYISEVDVDYDGHRVVLNGIVNRDSLFRVNLSYSRNGWINDWLNGKPSKEFIPDAEVGFFLNQQFLGYMEPDGEKGNYCMTGYHPEAGDKIALEVLTTQQEKVFAESTVPPLTKITHIDTTMIITQGGSGEYMGKLWIDMHLRQETPGKNYYLLMLTDRWEYQEDGQRYSGFPILTLRNESIHSHAETYYMNSSIYSLVVTQENTYLYCPYVIFSGDFFDEKNNRLSAEIQNISFSYSGEEYSSNQSYLTFYLYTLSPSFYLYLRSKYLQYEDGNAIFPVETQEQIPTFTNVQGGYGVFSLISHDWYEILLASTDFWIYPGGGYYPYPGGGYGNYEN